MASKHKGIGIHHPGIVGVAIIALAGLRDVIGAVDVEQIGIGVVDLRKLQVVVIQQLFHQADHRQRGDFCRTPSCGDRVVQMFADPGNFLTRHPIGGQTLRAGDLRIDQAQSFEAVSLQ